MSDVFRPGWILTLLTGLGLAVLLALGTWQLNRLAWKTDLIERIEAGLATPAIPIPEAGGKIEPYRQYEVPGHIRQEPVFLLGFSAHGAQGGSQLLQIFDDTKGRQWLLERGWIPDDLADQALQGAFATKNELEMVVVTRPARRRGIFTPENDLAAQRLYSEDIDELNSAFDLALEPIPLVAAADIAGASAWDGLPLSSKPSPDLPNNHLGYVVTWYGLAVALIGVYIAFGRARAKEFLS